MTPGVAHRPYRLLCVFAHPDDESFGPGGTIAKYTARGESVGLITFTRGERSTVGTSLEHTPEGLAAARVDELHRAAGILGASVLGVYSYPDLGLSNIPQAELVEQVISAIRKFKPDALLAFDRGGVSGHPDHVAASEAATAAFNTIASQAAAGPYAGPSRLYYWVVPRSIATRLNETLGVSMIGFADEQITCVIDVRDYLDVQRRAVIEHATQSTPLPKLYQARVAAQGGKEYLYLAGSAIPGDQPPKDDLLGGLPAL